MKSKDIEDGKTYYCISLKRKVQVLTKPQDSFTIGAGYMDEEGEPITLMVFLDDLKEI